MSESMLIKIGFDNCLASDFILFSCEKISIKIRVKVCKKLDLPIIKKGAAKFMPMNSIPKYIASPKPAAVAMTADTFPIRPSHGFDRTTSPIMQVMILLN